MSNQAAMLDEMDAVFGVSALVADEERAERSERYTAKQLRGLRVAHDLDAVSVTIHSLISSHLFFTLSSHLCHQP